MALSAASGISLLMTSAIISGAAAVDAFTMLCDLAANAQKTLSQAAGTRGDDETVPLHLHACRLIASFVSSSSSSSREQFETICKLRVVPSVSSCLCAAFKIPASIAASAAAEDDAEATVSTSHLLPPSVACVTALCRCSTLVPPVVASFMPELIQHLQVTSVCMTCSLQHTAHHTPAHSHITPCGGCRTTQHASSALTSLSIIEQHRCGAADRNGSCLG